MQRSCPDLCATLESTDCEQLLPAGQTTSPTKHSNSKHCERTKLDLSFLQSTATFPSPSFQPQGYTSAGSESCERGHARKSSRFPHRPTYLVPAADTGTRCGLDYTYIWDESWYRVSYTWRILYTLSCQVIEIPWPNMLLRTSTSGTRHHGRPLGNTRRQQQTVVD